MSDQTIDRRNNSGVVMVVSKDEPWLHFAANTLRRTDKVVIAETLESVQTQIQTIQPDIVVISSELIPQKIKEFETLVQQVDQTVWVVLKSEQDHHHRISDKHLEDMGVKVELRTENAKVFRKLVHHLMSNQADRSNSP